MNEESAPAPAGVGPGTQVAGYRLEQQIGRGGMAVVYRAFDERLERRVALKLLTPALAGDTAFRTRFIRESRAAAAVDHPNIIPVYDAGDAGGFLFISMRYVQGGDVRALLADGPLAPLRAWNIVTQVASALDAAHAHDLVHRDVKPANILLDSASGTTAAGRPAGGTTGEQRDHVYLSDFGISKQTLASHLTGTGQFVGTLDYIAPEQIEAQDVDGRADQYSLACAAFELLGGGPPFQKDQALGLISAHLSERPPSLVTRRPELPAAVDLVLAKAMAKNPADRYGSCGEFAADLGRALGLVAGQPAAATAGGGARAWPATELVTPASGPQDMPTPPGGGVVPPVGKVPGAGKASRTRKAPRAGGQANEQAAAAQAAAAQAAAAQAAAAPPVAGPGPAEMAGAATVSTGLHGGPDAASAPGVAPTAQQAPGGTWPPGSYPGYAPPGTPPGTGWPQYPAPQPAKRSRGLLAGVVVGVVAAAAAVAIVIALGHNNGPPDVIGSKSPTPHKSLVARTQATAINNLLSTSMSSRTSWDNLVSDVGNCSNLPFDISQIRKIASERSTELNAANGLQTDALPGGATVKADLVRALQLSLTVDDNYLKWAEQQQSTNCGVGTSSSYYQTAAAQDPNATAAKQAFLSSWNPIAGQYGFPIYLSGDI